MQLLLYRPEHTHFIVPMTPDLCPLHDHVHSMPLLPLTDFEKPFDSPAILVVGHQTDGKSALVEALMGEYCRGKILTTMQLAPELLSISMLPTFWLSAAAAVNHHFIAAVSLAAVVRVTSDDR